MSAASANAKGRGPTSPRLRRAGAKNAKASFDRMNKMDWIGNRAPIVSEGQIQSAKPQVAAVQTGVNAKIFDRMNRMDRMRGVFLATDGHR